MPAQARKALGLPTNAHWHVFGSPELGVAIVLAPRQDPRKILEFLLRDDVRPDG